MTVCRASGTALCEDRRPGRYHLRVVAPASIRATADIEVSEDPLGSVIKKRRKRMAKKKHRKLLRRTRHQRRNKK
jgi:hypothetical protein